MAHSLGTIREFNTEHFRVIVDAVEEHDLDLSWDERGTVAEDINDGHLVAFCARARVITHTGIELASDYLGNCVYSDISSFEDHRECAAYTREQQAKGSTAVCGSYFSDMVRSVCAEARREYARIGAEITSVRLRAV